MRATGASGPVDDATVTVLRHGAYVAHVSAQGAAVRGLTHDGRHLVVAEEAVVPTPPYAGAVLAPWPNRIADGKYVGAGGTVEQLPVNETDRGNALHGLVLWEEWTVAERTASAVRLTHVLHPRPGYPHRLALRADYSLDDHGLSLSLRATSLGPARAPVGLSVHPYLTTGEDTELDEWTLTMPCRSVIETDERLLPQRVSAVAGTERDFTVGRRLGAAHLDHAFGDVAFDPTGRAAARLVGPGGHGVEVAWDRSAPWLQAYTLDLPVSPLHRRAVALEPMTCAPDAFNSGAGPAWLQRGDHLQTWCCFSAVVPVAADAPGDAAGSR